MKNIVKEFISFNYSIIFFILFSQVTYSQLSDFTLTVTNTNETCEDNAILSFTTSNTSPGATILYSVYLLPNTVTAIAVVSSNNLTGLSAGNYRVVATQSLGGESNFKQQDITILNQVVPLSYQLIGQNVVCGNDGKITVDITQGNAVSYEIISGPVIKPLQASNIFTELVEGVYVIRVFDACGDAIVQTYTLFSSPGDLDISLVNTVNLLDCDSAIITQTINSGGGAISYPVTLQYTLTPPSGSSIVINQTITSGSGDFINISQEIPISGNETYSYTLLVTDGCGNVYNVIGTIGLPTTDPSIVFKGFDCGGGNYSIKNAESATVIEAPAEYPYALPHVLTESDEENTFLLDNLPPGSYTFSVVDICGIVHTLTLTVMPVEPSPPGSSVRLGCESGYGSVKLSTVSGLQTVIITQAPIAYSGPIPHDVSFNIDGTENQDFWMNSLPAGTYVFNTLDNCGDIYDVTVTITDFQQTTDIDIIEHCGSFDLFINHTSSVLLSMSFWLQKYDPISNSWGHPITGAGYIEGATPTGNNSVLLINNSINYNISSFGEFRILGRYAIYGNGTPSKNCIVVLEGFEFLSEPKISNVFSFSCENNAFDVIVDAVGIGELSYKITAKNGEPFVVDNGTSNIFLDLEAGTYSFQVEDECGNILNADFEVGESEAFPITAINLCNQQTGSLSVPLFSFLSYEWWKDDAESVILSTSNVLELNSIDPADSGTYHVRVVFTADPASCVNFVSDIVVLISDVLPNAGEGANILYCGPQGQVDLFSLLSGTFDANGIWGETTNSGMLSNNLWDATDLPFGVYSFNYTVTDLCDNVDQAIVNITINPVPEAPVITVDPVICNSQILQFFSSTVENGIYQWTGPNGFNSNEQNPFIENISSLNDGTYFLKVLSNGCESETVSVVVAVSDFPIFSLDGGCTDDDADYVLTALPLENSFNVDDVAYNWTGPDGFTGNQNPMVITNNLPGIYTLTVTNANGCSDSVDIEVFGTLCRIPRGISPNSDGENDAFDLSGYNVSELKIFNRYGTLVYEKNGYRDEWYGQDYKGRELPDATYFYHVLLGSGQERVGWVYVNK